MEVHRARTSTGADEVTALETANFRIEGMHCEGLAERIRKLLQRQHGVREAHVPFAGGGEATVRFNPHVITRDGLVTVVRETGYDVGEAP